MWFPATTRRSGEGGGSAEDALMCRVLVDEQQPLGVLCHDVGISILRERDGGERRTGLLVECRDRRHLGRPGAPTAGGASPGSRSA